MRADRVKVHYARSNALDVLVELDGDTWHVMDVGIGHPPHVIQNGRGRVASGLEIALAEALASASTQPSQREDAR